MLIIHQIPKTAFPGSYNKKDCKIYRINSLETKNHMFSLKVESSPLNSYRNSVCDVCEIFSFAQFHRFGPCKLSLLKNNKLVSTTHLIPEVNTF